VRGVDDDKTNMDKDGVVVPADSMQQGAAAEQMVGKTPPGLALKLVL